MRHVHIIFSISVWRDIQLNLTLINTSRSLSVRTADCKHTLPSDVAFCHCVLGIYWTSRATWLNAPRRSASSASTGPAMVPPSGKWWRKLKSASTPSTLAPSVARPRWRDEPSASGTVVPAWKQWPVGPGPTTPPLQSQWSLPSEDWRNWKTSRSPAVWDLPSLQ